MQKFQLQVKTLINTFKQSGVDVNIDASSSHKELSDVDLRSMFSEVVKMMSSLHNWEEKIYTFGQDLTKLRSDVKQIDKRVHHGEQYSKNYNLLIHNLENIPKDRHGLSFNNYVTNEINKMPLMRYLPNENGEHGHTKISPKDIDISHIYKTKKKGTDSNVVIVRFKSRALRNEIYSLKKKLKGYVNRNTGKKITITEHLTTQNLKLYAKAQEQLGFGKVWTIEGRIMTISNNSKTQLHDLPDIMKAKRTAQSALDPSNTQSFPLPN